MSNIAYQYSNGFDLKKVSSALSGRFGWLQSTTLGAPVISAGNLESKSGRFFNDGSFHSLLTVDNIKQSQENPKITDTQLNALLQQKVTGATMRALTSVFTQMEYFDKQVLLYERYPKNTRPVQNIGLAAGYEINIPKRVDITAQIITATLLFDSDVTFNLYLFKDGITAPVWQQQVMASANDETKIDFTDLFLNYSNDFKGGKYYLCYFQSELLGAQAIQEQVTEWNKTHCVSAVPFIAKETGSLVFDKQNLAYPFLPYGINLEIQSFKDWTQDIIKRTNLFDNLIGLNMAYQVIEDLLYTNRSNSSERNNKTDMQAVGMQLELVGAAPISGAPKIIGLRQRIEQETERVHKEFIYKRFPKVTNLSECYEQRLARME